MGHDTAMHHPYGTGHQGTIHSAARRKLSTRGGSQPSNSWQSHCSKRYHVCTEQKRKQQILASMDPQVTLVRKASHQGAGRDIVQLQGLQHKRLQQLLLPTLYSFLPALLIRDLWMCGMTPPPAMVACIAPHKTVHWLTCNRGENDIPQLEANLISHRTRGCVVP